MYGRQQKGLNNTSLCLEVFLLKAMVLFLESDSRVNSVLG